MAKYTNFLKSFKLLCLIDNRVKRKPANYLFKDILNQYVK